MSDTLLAPGALLPSAHAHDTSVAPSSRGAASDAAKVAQAVGDLGNAMLRKGGVSAPTVLMAAAIVLVLVCSLACSLRPLLCRRGYKRAATSADEIEDGVGEDGAQDGAEAEDDLLDVDSNSDGGGGGGGDATRRADRRSQRMDHGRNWKVRDDRHDVGVKGPPAAASASSRRMGANGHAEARAGVAAGVVAGNAAADDDADVEEYLRSLRAAVEADVANLKSLQRDMD